MWVGGRRAVSMGQRELMWSARQCGHPIWFAAQVAGVSQPAAWAWIQQRGGVRPRRPVPVSGRFLSLAEREEIAAGVAGGESIRSIAGRLGRAPSTVSREVRRNRVSVGYRAVAADRQAEARRRRPKPVKLVVNERLRRQVQQWLRLRWSPAEIAARLVVQFPDEPEMRVSPETIYQSIYVQGRGALRRELAVCLRTGRALRRPQRRAEQRRGRIPGMVMISERPAEVADRAVPGHWEGDLIMGQGNHSAIGTLVERSTRYCLLLHLGRDYRPETVRDAMIDTIQTLPTHLRRSLTWDQGRELRRHADITLATGMDIYFCDPHSPWQRGTNENTNGLLRQYFPKGTPLAGHTREHLDHVAAELNGRPRKTLHWQTPAEALNQLLLQ